MEEYERARGHLLDQIRQVLESDRRVVAAWLTGSVAAGTADAWSDLDLHVVIADEAYTAVVVQRDRFYRQFGEPALIQEIKLNTESPAYFNLLVYPGALEVDCSLWPLHLARRHAVSLLLFDHVGIPVDVVAPMMREERRREAHHQLDFFWAMAVVALKCVGRRYSTGAAFTVEMMTDAFDTLWRLVRRPEDLHPEMLKRRHRPMVPDLAAITPRLGATIDPLAALHVVRQLCAETESLHPELAALGVPIPTAMPGEIARLSALAEVGARQEPSYPTWMQGDACGE